MRLLILATTLGLMQPELARLTVPADALPQGCVMPQSSSVSVDSRMRGGLWGSLPITSNPWTGADAGAVMAIRERVDPPTSVPDGPPLSPTERARFRIKLAEDVERAYAAIYTDAFDRRVVVYGIKYVNKPTLTVNVVGTESDCADVVNAHVASLVRR